MLPVRASSPRSSFRFCQAVQASRANSAAAARGNAQGGFVLTLQGGQQQGRQGRHFLLAPWRGRRAR